METEEESEIERVIVTSVSGYFATRKLGLVYNKKNL